MRQMNFRSDIGLKIGHGPACPTGAKFLRRSRRGDFGISTYEKFKKDAYGCRLMSKWSIDVYGKLCGKTLMGDAG